MNEGLAGRLELSMELARHVRLPPNTSVGVDAWPDDLILAGPRKINNVEEQELYVAVGGQMSGDWGTILYRGPDRTSPWPYDVIFYPRSYRVKFERVVKSLYDPNDLDYEYERVLGRFQSTFTLDVGRAWLWAEYIRREKESGWRTVSAKNVYMDLILQMFHLLEKVEYYYDDYDNNNSGGSVTDDIPEEVYWLTYYDVAKIIIPREYIEILYDLLSDIAGDMSDYRVPKEDKYFYLEATVRGGTLHVYPPFSLLYIPLMYQQSEKTAIRLSPFTHLLGDVVSYLSAVGVVARAEAGLLDPDSGAGAVAEARQILGELARKYGWQNGPLSGRGAVNV